MTDTLLPNRPEDEGSRLVLAAREALTDSMVERLAATGANALELIDRLNDEATSAALHSLIDRLTEMHKVGALDTLCDTVMMLHAARNALTDPWSSDCSASSSTWSIPSATRRWASLRRRRASLSRRRPSKARAPRRAAACWRCCRCCPTRRRSAASAFLLAFADRMQRRSAG